MHHQVGTTSSKNSDELSIFSDWSSADTIALIAVVVSLITWWRSRTIEERIRADSDERAKFDVVFGNPVVARLEALEITILEVGRAIRNSSSMTGVAATISTIQKHEHSEWYFSLQSLVSNHDELLTGLLASELNEYWDRASFLIDEISNATSKDRAVTIFRQLQSLADGYLVRSRKLIVEHRTSIRGEAPAILNIPFRKKN